CHAPLLIGGLHQLHLGPITAQADQLQTLGGQVDFSGDGEAQRVAVEGERGLQILDRDGHSVHARASHAGVRSKIASRASSRTARTVAARTVSPSPGHTARRTGVPRAPAAGTDARPPGSGGRPPAGPAVASAATRAGTSRSLTLAPAVPGPNGGAPHSG